MEMASSAATAAAAGPIAAVATAPAPMRQNPIAATAPAEIWTDGIGRSGRSWPSIPAVPVNGPFADNIHVPERGARMEHLCHPRYLTGHLAPKPILFERGSASAPPPPLLGKFDCDSHNDRGHHCRAAGNQRMDQMRRSAR